MKRERGTYQVGAWERTNVGRKVKIDKVAKNIEEEEEIEVEVLRLEVGMKRIIMFVLNSSS